jgi:hypothetical protein
MPYNPSVNPRGDAYLFQGITNAANSIADAIMRRDERAQQEADGAKAVDFMLKASPELKQRLGLTDKELGTLGARDKISLGTGLMKSLALEQIVGELGEAAARRKGREQLPQLNAAFADRISPQNGPAMPPMAAWGSVARDYPDAAAQLSPHMLTKLMPEAGDEAFFKPGETEFKLPGVKGVLRVPTGPKTSVVMMDPDSAGNATRITGPGGEDLGFGLPGRSGVTPLKTGEVRDKDKYDRLSKQLNALISAQGKAITQKARDAYQEQISTVEQQIQSLEESAEPPAAQAPAASGKRVRYKIVNGQLQQVTE